MTIYLVHYVVIWYVEWAINDWKRVDWSDISAGSSWDKARQLPLWGIPIVVAISIPLATVIFYAFEEPIRRFLKN
jgi:peptidoglycan/LPS O-acetylase OafA/YrhL